MRSVVAAAALSLFLALLGTPLYIKFLVKRGYGQFIRDDGPTTHKTKRGTPTMGGVVIIGATIVGYFGSHLLTMTKPDGTVSLGLTPSSLLVLGLMTGLGFVGWLDDFIKISKQRSLGLRSAQKLFGQLLVGSAFAVAAVTLTNARGTPLASTKISFVRDIGWLDLFAAGSVVGLILVVLWMNLIVAGTSNGVNLTDGLDGLAAGASAIVLVAMAGIAFIIGRNTSDPGITDLMVVAGCVGGAALGFLWYNTFPADVFMGDTGSLGLGGAVAGLAVMTRTELVLLIIGGLFVLEAGSVAAQVVSFKLFKRRVLLMAPLHHHFELKAWSETKIIVRFWIVAAIFAGAGFAAYYATF